MSKVDSVFDPGDLVDLVSRLRAWGSDRDTDAYLIERSFEPYGLEIEAAAARARPLVQDAANAVFQLVTLIEKTSEYKKQAASTNANADVFTPASRNHARP